MQYRDPTKCRVLLLTVLGSALLGYGGGCADPPPAPAKPEFVWMEIYGPPLPPSADPPASIVRNPIEDGQMFFRGREGKECVAIWHDHLGELHRPDFKPSLPWFARCPPALNDPIWEECRLGRVLWHPATDTCECAKGRLPEQTRTPMTACPSG